MTYPAFQPATPAITQARQVAVDGVRNNLLALRDILVAGGCAHGWSMSVGGSAEQPATVLYSRGTERVLLTITWGATGGAAGNPIKASYQYSANSGGSFDPLADAAGNYVMSLTWDSSGNLTATTWGATP